VDYSNWSPDSDPCDPSKPWADVTCQDGHVVELQLIKNNLIGTMPPRWDLGSLQTLNNVFNPMLIGAVPTISSQLLRDVYLNNNGFTTLPNSLGSIPSSWDNLGNITTLDLSNNNLTGTVPDAFVKNAQFTLKNINLGGNPCMKPLKENPQSFQVAPTALGPPAAVSAPCKSYIPNAHTPWPAPSPIPDFGTAGRMQALSCIAIASLVKP